MKSKTKPKIKLMFGYAEVFVDGHERWLCSEIVFFKKDSDFIRVVLLPLAEYRRLRKIEKVALEHLTCTGGNSPSLENLQKAVGHAKK